MATQDVGSQDDDGSDSTRSVKASSRQRCFTPNIKLTGPTDGVLEATLHTEGESLLIDATHYRQLASLFSAIGHASHVKALLVTGAEDCFSRMPTNPKGVTLFRAPASSLSSSRKEMFDAFLKMRVPSVAALNGPVAGMADYLVLFDAVLAVPSVEFAETPEVDVGVFTDRDLDDCVSSTGGARVGAAIRPMTAVEARDWGLVNEIVPTAELLESARRIASSLASMPALD